MAKQDYSEWKNRLEESRKKLSDNPDDPDLAAETWALLEGPDYFNFKSSNEALSIFSCAARATDKGVILMAYAFKELLEKSGEAAERGKFDTKLLLSIERASKGLEGADKDVVLWLIDSIN